MSAKQMSWLLILCGLLGCKSEAEQRREERARLRAGRLRRAIAKQESEEDKARRQQEALAEEARRRKVALEATRAGEAGDEKPGKRRHRLTFPSWPRVVGGLSKRTVRRTLKRHKWAINKCIWKGWKAKPPLRGTVRLAFAVGLTGKITRLSVEYGGTPHPPTTACLRKKILAWRFPRNKREPTLVGVSAVGRRKFTRRYWRTWHR